MNFGKDRIITEILFGDVNVMYQVLIHIVGEIILLKSMEKKP